MKKFVRITVILFILNLGTFSLFAQTVSENIRKEKILNRGIQISSSKIRADSLNCKLIGGWFGGYFNTIFIDSAKDTLVYIGDVSYLRILNVSDPSSPSEIGHYATEGEAQAVYLVDSLAYVADSDSGLRVLNLSDPISPFEIGCYPLDCFIGGLQVVDTVAYATVSADGLYIINFSNPANPYLAGFYYTGHHTYDVYVRDNLAYLTYGGIYIIDVSTPANLDEIGSCGLGMGDNAVNVKVIDTLAYATDDDNDLHIINVSDPTDPLEIGFYYDVANPFYSLADI
jgi:hypothetical protein